MTAKVGPAWIFKCSPVVRDLTRIANLNSKVLEYKINADDFYLIFQKSFSSMLIDREYTYDSLIKSYELISNQLLDFNFNKFYRIFYPF